MNQQLTDLDINHIVACAHNRTIGADGGLPWHIPEDFRWFKKVTMGHPVIMGRRTYESIGRPLPGRLNLVISRNKDWQAPGVETFTSIEAALDYCKSVTADWGHEVYIIGGGELYAATLPLVDRIFLTEIDLKVDGDTFYPEIPADQFLVVSEEARDSSPNFKWLVYKRVKD